MNEQQTATPDLVPEQKGKAGQIMTAEGWKDPPLLAALDHEPADQPTEAPALGLEAAERMQTLSAAAARDILLLGQTVLDIAERINAECRRMAEDMAEQGNAVSQHIRDFATIARVIGVTNRDTRLRIAGELQRREGE